MTRKPAKPDPKPPGFEPYADDSAASAIGGLTLENGRDRVALYGSLDLTRDRAGLEQARQLRALLEEVVRVLESDPALPDAIGPPREPDTVKNPFA